MNVNRTQRTFSDLTLDVSLLRNGSGLSPLMNYFRSAFSWAQAIILNLHNFIASDHTRSGEEGFSPDGSNCCYVGGSHCLPQSG